MKHLSIDLETFSSVPIGKSGAYKYIQSSDFEILLLAYSVDNAPVEIIDLAQGEAIPEWLNDAIKNPEYVKHAYNAVFEITCLSKFYGFQLPIEQWRDTMLHGLYCGYTAGLDATGNALGLAEDKKKLLTGKALIRYFCVPCKPTKSNGGRTRNFPKHDLEKWDLFKDYCKGDVIAEMEIERRLSNFPVPNEIQKQWETDLIINSRGVAVDISLVQGALKIAADTTEKLMTEAVTITGLENPNSVSQLSKWLESQTGNPVYNLQKDTVTRMLKNGEVTGKAARMLKIRQELDKTSTKKYDAVQNCICDDGRVRGLLQFYGASRTGRWSGRLVQLQNLPRTYIDIKQLPLAREIVEKMETDKLQLLFGSVNNTLSQLIRTSFVSADDKILVDADFSSIEARVVAWLANESWKIKAFQEGKDIYCETASAMFGVPVEKHGANAELRQKGKIAELACIAEGELVLTDKGLIPIEEVTTAMRVWDGEDWVNHDGVIFKGERDVIEYSGLIATPDHEVFVKNAPYTMPLIVAAENNFSLKVTGLGEKAVTKYDWLIEYRQLKRPRYCGKKRVYDILNAGKHHCFTVSGKLVHNCGYGGSSGALIAMGALDMGIAEDDLPDIVARWRGANKNIVRLWYAVEKAAITTIQTGRQTAVNNLIFAREFDTTNDLDFLTITLPSGRKLYYSHPALDQNAWGSPAITYWGVNQTTKQWTLLDTFGGKLVENCVQSIARDCLAIAIERLEKAGYPIIFHVHDEVVIECDKDKANLNRVVEIMKTPTTWAQGLPIDADGWVGSFFRKD